MTNWYVTFPFKQRVSNQPRVIPFGSSRRRVLDAWHARVSTQSQQQQRVGGNEQGDRRSAEPPPHPSELVRSIRFAQRES